MHGSDPGATPKNKAEHGSRRQLPLLSLADPQPVATTAQLWRGAAQVATIGIFVVLLLAALELARAVLIPIASSFVVTMMLGPLSARAERYRLPNILTTIALWLLVIAVFYGLIALLASPVIDWVGKAPDIGRTFQEKLRLLEGPIASLRDLRNALLPGEAGKGLGIDIMSVVTPAVGVLTPAVGEMFIFFGTLFFMLLGRSRLRHVVVALFHKREARLRTLRIMNDIEHNLTGYLSVVTMINACVGVGAGVIAWAVGLPDPLAWGVLGFVLNYIPYIGALIMEIGMFAVGLVSSPSLTYALIAPISYLALGILEGHFITPSILGRHFTLNPLTVFLSLVFWTWLWGPVGAFLAAPLLIMGLVVVVHLFPQQAPELPE